MKYTIQLSYGNSIENIVCETKKEALDIINRNDFPDRKNFNMGNYSIIVFITSIRLLHGNTYITIE